MRITKISLIAFFLLIVTSGPLPAQWHLQNYYTVIGKDSGGALGSVVKGLGDFYHDGKKYAAIYHSGYTEIWALSPSDTAPKVRYRGKYLEHGDINGDGYEDFVIGKPMEVGAGFDTVFIYLGDSGGIDTIADLILQGENRNDGFGSEIAIGDINNDGTSDLVIAATEFSNQSPDLIYRGRVYIYFGRHSFLAIPDLVLTGGPLEKLGRQCRIADVNSDEKADLIVSGYNTQARSDPQSWFNYLNVYFGKSNFDTIPGMRFKLHTGFRYPNPESFALMDANGDGKTDILWPYQDDTTDYITRTHVYFGGNGLDTTVDVVIPPPDAANMNFPVIRDAGDMDGDGYHDIAMSDPGELQGGGIVVIFRGGPHISTTFNAGASQVRGGYFGSSIDSVGDVNGDGLADIIVGEPQYTFDDAYGAFGIYLGNAKINAVKGAKPVPLPNAAVLKQNYPNPFNPETRISYALTKSGEVTLKIFDVLGKQISIVDQGHRSPGEYSAVWPTEHCSAGVFFCQLVFVTTEGVVYTDTKKMILLP